MRTTPATWSNSKLALRKTCGWAFQREILEGVAREPNPALDGGSDAHDAIYLFVRAILDDGIIDVNSIARMASAGRPEDMANLLPILTVMQEAMIEDDPPIRPKHVIHVEKRLAMDVVLSDGRAVVFDGKADLVSADRTTCIVEDWKTHWRPLRQEVFEHDPQLKRYALLADAKHEGFERFNLRMRFVRYAGVVREITLLRADLELVRWDLIAAIEEAEANEDFEATPGDWCNLCGHTAACPVFQEFLAGGIELGVTNDEQAAKMAQVVRVIDAFSSTAKRKLKGFLGADHPTGRVPLSGGTYGFGPMSKRKVAAKDVLEIWDAFSRPQNPHVLRVDVDELRRSLDREPGAVREAMAAAVMEYEEPHCRYRRGDALDETEELAE